ncbi:helix-turn-helix domain-containing protein [Zoogloea oryzae]|uniref:helix-turn-helix domain-containing protein n=1 Tax=Zoogloea oryzae TaxID=310767 RepID=UPI0024E15CAF|nr:helix-turn-helix domain-containing protein [Zoogloea oryzae]
MTTTSSSTLLTRLEAAQLLRIQPQTLAVWASTKRYPLPVVKVGRLVRYRLADLEQFMKGGE